MKREALHASTAKRINVRAHDLRATFITLELAAGKTETWVMDRTGHTSSTMINRYRRKARMVAELRLGSLGPLYVVIPELASLKPDDCEGHDAPEAETPPERVVH